MPANPDGGTPQQASDDRGFPLTDAVLAELAASEAEATALGVAALSLARRIDRDREGGSAHAALVGRLQVVMAAALDGARPAQSDPIDELRKRREQRRQAREAGAT